MQCPLCKKEMQIGKIYKDRYDIRWISDLDDKGVFPLVSKKAIKLTTPGKMYIEAFLCEECKKIIINVDSRLSNI